MSFFNDISKATGTIGGIADKVVSSFGNTILHNNNETFSPQKFRDSFKRGIGRPSLFLFKITRYPNIYYSKQPNTAIGGALSKVLPNSIRGINTNTLIGGIENLTGSKGTQTLIDLQFRVSQFNLPDKQLQTFTTKIYGPSVESPKEIENSSMTMTVLCSGDYFEHDFFQFWIDSVVSYDHKKNGKSYDLQYYDDIITSAELTVYDEDGKNSYTITFEEVYPSIVGGVNFDWDRRNEISEFNVTLNYRTMKVEKIRHEGGIGGAIDTVMGISSGLKKAISLASVVKKFFI